MTLLHMWPTCFSNCCLCAETASMSVHDFFKNRISVSHSPLVLLDISPTVFKARCHGGSPSSSLGCMKWAKASYSSRRSFTFLISLLLANWAPRVWVLTRPCICLSSPSWYGFFFLSLGVSSCSASLQVFSRENCSICRCSFVVSMEVSPGFSYTVILTLPL